jgi:hypothetical protein
MGGAPGEGWAVLRALLLGGALSAYRDERTGQTVAIDPSFWAEQVAFEVSETKKLFGGKAAYMIQGEILIDQAQLSTLIHLVRDRLANPQGVPRNTGGAPPKYDGEPSLLKRSALCTKAIRCREILQSFVGAPWTALLTQAMGIHPSLRPGRESKRCGSGCGLDPASEPDLIEVGPTAVGRD